MTKPTYEELAWALVNMMDGMKEHEIQEITGLPEEECARIWQIYSGTLPHTPFTPPTR